jgi:hypothetical protein
MTRTIRSLGLAATSVLILTLATAPQARAQSAPSAAANVYIQIQGPEGAIYGFTASSTGKLSALPGAPWNPAGVMIGITGPWFLTLGEDLLHSYEMSANGSIEVMEQYDRDSLYAGLYSDYPGANCGSGPNSQNNAVLDHTGQYVYLLNVDAGNGTCVAYQSWLLNHPNDAGDPNWDGYTELNTTAGQTADLPSILGNESFAYADLTLGNPGITHIHSSSVIGFQRESTGMLNLMQFHETDPTLVGGAYAPYRPDASPTGSYLVLQLYANGLGMGQLGSYTVDPSGNIASTNTTADMPTSPFYITGTTFSPSGNLFVTYADNGATAGAGNGIEIYNFNGAAPLTPNTALLSGTPIDQVAWDSSNHLYAISQSTNTLYVYTVTPTSVTQDTAWSIGSPFKMIVVSK